MARVASILPALVVLAGACSSLPSAAPGGEPFAAPAAAREAGIGLSAPAEVEPPPAGNFTFSLANDIFAGKDGGYTAGIGFTWTTAEVNAYDPGNFARRLTRALSFLPTVGGRKFRNYLQFTLRGELYTPADITNPDPPPGAQPYAGLWYLDTSVLSKNDVSLHDFGFRIGLVGPLAQGEAIQKWVHSRTGSPEPQGWHTQLGNEIFVNALYQFHRRILRSARGPVGYDLTMNVGGGLGTYYIGANMGAVVRLGFRLPDNYGDGTLTGQPTWLVGLRRYGGRYSDERLFGYFFAAAEGNVVGRFLPTDGNLFKNSRSGDRETAIGALIGGVVLGIDHWLLTFTWNLAGDPIRPVASNDDFGVITISYLF